MKTVEHYVPKEWYAFLIFRIVPWFGLEYPKDKDEINLDSRFLLFLMRYIKKESLNYTCTVFHTAKNI